MDGCLDVLGAYDVLGSNDGAGEILGIPTLKLRESDAFNISSSKNLSNSCSSFSASLIATDCEIGPASKANSTLSSIFAGTWLLFLTKLPFALLPKLLAEANIFFSVPLASLLGSTQTAGLKLHQIRVVTKIESLSSLKRAIPPN